MFESFRGPSEEVDDLASTLGGGISVDEATILEEVGPVRGLGAVVVLIVFEIDNEGTRFDERTLFPVLS